MIIKGKIWARNLKHKNFFSLSSFNKVLKSNFRSIGYSYLNFHRFYNFHNIFHKINSQNQGTFLLHTHQILHRNLITQFHLSRVNNLANSYHINQNWHNFRSFLNNLNNFRFFHPYIFLTHTQKYIFHLINRILGYIFNKPC